MNGSCYVGIDVSKDALYVAIRPIGEVFSVANSASGIRKLLGKLAAMTIALICLEATYEQRNACAFYDAGFKVAIANPHPSPAPANQAAAEG